MKAGNYLVAWSGGLDSTLLIFKLLSAGHRVRAVYVKLANNEKKSERELSAINAMFPILKSMFKDQFTFDGVASDVNVRLWGCTGFTQPIIWLSALALAWTAEETHAAIGYISGDDAMAYADELRLVWRSLLKLRKLVSGGSDCRLEFPLSKHTKFDVVQEIPGDLAEHCVFCEHGDREPCGHCLPCDKWSFNLSHGLHKSWRLNDGREDIDKLERRVLLRERRVRLKSAKAESTGVLSEVGEDERKADCGRFLVSADLTSGGEASNEI